MTKLLPYSVDSLSVGQFAESYKKHRTCVTDAITLVGSE